MEHHTINQLTDTGRPARILLFPSAYYPNFGGVEEICRLLAQNLKMLGFEVAIAVNRSPADTKEREELWGTPVYRFDFAAPGKRDIWRCWQILPRSQAFNRFLDEWKPDLIHAICPSVNSFYLWLSQVPRRCKVVLTLQGEFFMDQHDIYTKSAFARWSVQRLLTVCDAITACSKYVLHDARCRFTLPKVPQSIVFNGVDLSEGKTLPVIQSRRQYILAVGRVVKNKNFDTLIRAFALIAGEQKDLQLVLAGNGDQLPALRSLAERLAIADRVDFVGRQDRDQISKLFSQCLFFVIPSAVEPFGIVCLEAMRAGKAVIACNAGGPPEFISNGETGLLVTPRHETELADALSLLVADSLLREKMGANAFSHVQSFSWTKITSQYIDIYRQCLSKAVASLEAAR